MEVGADISQKIRSAIKAKLVDLGAYVDDELPDYIMVMVANKKSQATMTDDLNLFLGGQTDEFTTWLHGLLAKLESITAAEPPTGTADPTEPPAPTPAAVPLTTTTPGSAAPVIPTPPVAAVIPSPPSSTSPSKAKSFVQSNVDEAKEAVEPPHFDIAVEKDDFEEVAPVAGKKGFVPRSAKTSSKPTPSSSKSSPPDRRRESSGRHRESSHSNRLSSRDQVKPTRTRSSAEEQDRRVDGGSRKRRALVSAIGAVVKRPSRDIPDEPYDPYRPAIGSVASVVRAPPRKDLPAGMQANKSLLLRAVGEAEHSIEAASKKLAGKATTMRSTAQESVRKSIHSRLGQVKRLEITTTTSMKSDAASQDGTRPRKSELKLYSRSKKREMLDRIRAQLSDSEPEEEKKKPQPEKQSQKVEMQEVILLDSGSDSPSTGQAKMQHIGYSEDSRLIHCEGEGSDMGDLLDLLIESGAEESDFEDQDNNQSVAAPLSRPSGEVTRSEQPVSPKFVVTLDGIDDDYLPEQKLEEEEEVEQHEQETIASDQRPRLRALQRYEDVKRNIVHVKPQQQPAAMVAPQVQQLTINLGDSDGEFEEAKVVPDRSADKCKFFPNCKNGDECPFYHPTEPCRNMPACTFGDKCMYVHPQCKFDQLCTRPDCAYSHTSPRPSSAVQTALPVLVQPIRMPMYPMQGMQGGWPAAPPRGPPAARNPNPGNCRFFPNCTNMSCPYTHPKPCRYGVGCSNKTRCSFTHPSLPNKNQLRWTAKLTPDCPAPQ